MVEALVLGTSQCKFKSYEKHKYPRTVPVVIYDRSNGWGFVDFVGAQEYTEYMIETAKPDKVLLQISMLHNDHSDWGAKTNKQYEGMLKFEYALQAVVEWAIEKANQEIEPYDDISYGEAYAAQKVYELIKGKLQ